MVSRDFNNINEIRKTRTLLSTESDIARVADALSGSRKAAWNPAVKTALLIAQSAERAYQLARKAGEYAQKHEGCVEYYTNLNKDRPPGKWQYVDEKEAGVVDYDSPVFRDVGADGDPEALKAAQATWMAAQIYMNHEIRSIHDDVATPGFLGKAMSMGPKYAEGFKKAAAELYIRAAEMLRGENGHADTAERLKAVGEAILKYDVDDQKAPEPAQFLKSLLFQEQWGLQQANIVLNDEKWHLEDKYEETLKKLAHLTASALPPPKPKEGPRPEA